jgi:hypothetical protein
MIAFSNFEKIFNYEMNNNISVINSSNILPIIEEKEKLSTYQKSPNIFEHPEDSEKKLSKISSTTLKNNSISNKRGESLSNSSNNKIDDKKTPNPKYESSNTSINYETYKTGLVDLSNQKKNVGQKKILSIDMSSKKGIPNNSANKTETPNHPTETHIKKLFDYSEQTETKKIPYVIDLHPGTTKSTKQKKNNNLLSTIKKVASAKGIYEKFNI